MPGEDSPSAATPRPFPNNPPPAKAGCFVWAVTHVKFAGHRLGFLINLHSVLIKDGIKRIAL